MSRMTSRMLRLTLILSLTALLASCGSGDSEDEEYNLFNSTVNSEHTLAFNPADSVLYGWGANGWGQLGLGTRSDSNSPKPVVVPTGVTKYTQVSIGGGFGAAIGDDGNVYAWGHNTSGQLGDNTLTTRSKPGKVLYENGDPVTEVIAVAAGGAHCLALKSDLTLWAWGSNAKGQLGNGELATSKFATQVVTTGIIGDIVAIAAGGEFSLALTSDGTIYAWGSNSHGQMGDGSTVTVKTPKKVVIQENLTEVKIVGIAAGGSHVLAIDDNGSIWAWGYNGLGQLGDGTTATSKVPIKLLLKDADDVSISGVATSISAGLDHTLVVLDNAGVKTVYGWGLNKFGQLGNNDILDKNIPVLIPQKVVLQNGTVLDDVTSVTAYGHQSMALTGDNRLYTWGKNSRGQLGDGTRTSRSHAAQVDFP